MGRVVACTWGRKTPGTPEGVPAAFTRQRPGTRRPAVGAGLRHEAVHLEREWEVVMQRRGLTRVVPLVALAAVALASPARALEVGQKAPDFTLNAPGGKQVKLADLLGKGPIVLYTFIGAFNGP